MLAARSATPKIKSARTIVPSTTDRFRDLAQANTNETASLGSLRRESSSRSKNRANWDYNLPESAGIVIVPDRLSKDTLSCSETAAAAAAKSSARRASAAGKTRAARAARRRGHHAAGARRHRTHIVGEHHGIEAGAVRGAAIPLRRLSEDTLEGAAPIFLHAKGHRERQELLEHFGRLDHAIEALRFDVHEEIFKSQDAFESSRSLLGMRGHEQAKRANDRTGQDSGNDEG